MGVPVDLGGLAAPGGPVAPEDEKRNSGADAGAGDRGQEKHLRGEYAEEVEGEEAPAAAPETALGNAQSEEDRRVGKEEDPFFSGEGRDPWDSFYSGPSPAAEGAPGGWAPKSYPRMRGLKSQHQSAEGGAREGSSRGPAAVDPRGLASHRGDREARSGYRPGPVVTAEGPVNEERLSHMLGKVLRYHATDNGLVPNDEGYVMVSEVLAVDTFAGVREEDVRQVVLTSLGSKGARFEILDDEAAGGLLVRAKYRHAADGHHRREDRRRDREPRDGDHGGSRGHRHAPQEGQVVERGFRPYRPAGSDAATEGTADVAPQSHGGGDHRGAPKDNTSSSSVSGAAAVVDRGARHGQQADCRGYTPSSVYPREGDRQNSGYNDGVDWKERMGDDRRLRNGTSSNADTGASRQPAASDGAAVASTAAVTADDATDLAWELYHEPGTDRAWFWNAKTDEVFYADDETSGWEQYHDPKGRPWWYHEVSGRFFFEEEEE